MRTLHVATGWRFIDNVDVINSKQIYNVSVHGLRYHRGTRIPFFTLRIVVHRFSVLVSIMMKAANLSCFFFFFSCIHLHLAFGRYISLSLCSRLRANGYEREMRIRANAKDMARDSFHVRLNWSTINFCSRFIVLHVLIEFQWWCIRINWTTYSTKCIF